MSFFYNAKSVCQRTNLGIDVSCIFFDDRREISSVEFFSELETALKSNDTMPDCMVFVAGQNLISALKVHWDSPTQQDTFVTRGIRNQIHYIKEFHFYSWEATGLVEHHIHSTSQGGSRFTLNVGEILSQGLKSLVERNDVVQVAPAGHVFRHPSGTVNKLFIQARELAKSEPQLCFIGRLIVAQLENSVKDELCIVFIDTMSIYHYVHEALSFIGSSARIHSFHSYDDVKKITPPTEPYLVVISASTSGGMARQLHKNQRFDPRRLVTLVDMSSQGRSGSVLVALDKIDSQFRTLTETGVETEIELVGEHFSSKAKPPRAVTLGIPHTPKHLKAALKFFDVAGFSALNVPKQPSGTRVISLTPPLIQDGDVFDRWLRDEIRWSVSSSIDFIVHTNDDCSLALANRASVLLAEARGGGSIAVLSSALINHDVLALAKGILVVTALAGDGGQLREISRDLREYVDPLLPRHFLVGTGLPQSEEAWDRLKQFLERNTSHRRYGFSARLVLPTGPESSDDAWRAMHRLAEKADITELEHVSVAASIVTDSLQAATGALHAGANGYLAKFDGSALRLSEGFLFFDDVFKDRIQEVPEAAIFLAMSSAMQAARECKIPGNQLKPTGYESVVISPECFLRFNDSILQACLLRASLPSELDYSASPHLSKLMKEFLIKVFDRYSHSYGAAASEFAAALATGRLKLKKSDQDEVLSKAIDHVKAAPSALLGLLLLANDL
ncbi:hypothetical protein Herbaro_20165 [Herbaspirillum sp. WKF16]|uniref:hypothetical protein n=1 Tax=Herbaspirillum sp. WKF16 TaxID=3028312 RepID=UPI0023A9FAEC|nr:hypothetical protein [Herbaspirillum sp. WKF16]WDZ95765.1 hypothetical protein Herbaro_20165 [Herbaspirillum sp. WKF16]